MSMDAYGQNPHMSGVPLSEAEFQIFSEIRQEFAESEHRTCAFALEKPGSVFAMETLAGSIEFSIHAWGTRTKIHPNTPVLARAVLNEISEICTTEFQIIGASEEDVVSGQGIVQEAADLVVDPLTLRPLWEEDMALREHDFQLHIAEGSIVPTQMGYLRRVSLGRVVLPGVVSLSRLSTAGDVVETFFD
ncbi:hypothetical protein KC968_00030 [Candidatus Saccharibacteria bacterium]|nr:hypothetical protein [Candidatus Saccharibacteria bacterium]